MVLAHACEAAPELRPAHPARSLLLGRCSDPGLASDKRLEGRRELDVEERHCRNDNDNGGEDSVRGDRGKDTPDESKRERPVLLGGGRMEGVFYKVTCRGRSVRALSVNRQSRCCERTFAGTVGDANEESQLESALMTIETETCGHDAPNDMSKALRNSRIVL